MNNLRSGVFGTLWLVVMAAVVSPLIFSYRAAHAQVSAPDARSAIATVAPRQVAGPEVVVADNLILVPDKQAKSITGWLIVKAGCADEAEGQCRGIAHYLEHLLFINRDNEHRSKVAFFPDGSGNGWTTHRSTVYFQRFPSRRETDADSLDKLIGYFTGLLSDVRVDGLQADRERNVVLQEYQQNTGRNPFARFSVNLNLAMMPGEPLGQRVIGSPDTIRAFTAEAARAFHSRWYAANNAMILIHGPVDAESLRALAARHMAALPAKEIPANVWKSPRSYEPGRHVLRAKEKDARQIGVYLDKIVTYTAAAPEHNALDASIGVLSAFLSSRLQQSPGEILMERDGLVTDVRMSVYRVRDGAMRFTFSAVPATGVEAERVIEAATGYLADLAKSGLTSATVDRLKLRITNQRELLGAQPALYAQALVSWLSGHYDHRSWQERQALHEAVTADSVNRLLDLIRRPGREVAGILLPEGPVRPTAPTVARDLGSQMGVPNDAVPPLSITPIPQQPGQP